ncbi:hypothetical protein B0H10DRAFT_1297205 [Mycena sp. CBHHK59/15]|nr:hypothetical protein B0H10DRAFT_1297205 [Mycena sp. CBHHK59/15]
MEYVPKLLGHHDYRGVYSSLRIEVVSDGRLRFTVQSICTDKVLLITIDAQASPLISPALLALSYPIVFSNITLLQLSNISLDKSSWRLLCQCHNLSMVLLIKCPPLPLFKLILERAMRCIGVSKRCLPTQEYMNPDGQCQQFFPKLQVIALHTIDFGVPEVEGSAHFPRFIDVLRALLWTRRAGLCLIPNLRIEGCKNLFLEDLAHFKFFTNVWLPDGEGQSWKDKTEDGSIDVRSFSLNVFELMDM